MEYRAWREVSRAGTLLGGLFLIGGGFVAGGTLTGCAVPPATPPCTTVEVMNPATAVADHAAAPPGNSVQFDVGYAPYPLSTCAVPQIVYLPTMTSSDTVNVSLPSPGVATCIGTTTVPAILTDTRSKATATLTCK
jgi:hypothetical protein